MTQTHIRPASDIPASANEKTRRLQQWRTLFQAGFFTLFILAPVFNLFRYDLHSGHAWLLGAEWRLGIDAYLTGHISVQEISTNLFLRLFLPVFTAAGLFLFIAWKWGRIYCGWLCPHFSVVETINRLMQKASGKPSIWERKTLPPWRPDGTPWHTDSRWWWLVIPATMLFAFLWAVVLLTYLLPPDEIYSNLLHGTLTRNQTIFITAATIVFTAEFLFARHLFCRYVCAVGLFQSIAWISNRDAMVVGFERQRAAACKQCLPDRSAACEAVCPMRLAPRNIKRHMFTCTQCAQCINACAQSQHNNPDGPLLYWVQKETARKHESGFRTEKTLRFIR